MKIVDCFMFYNELDLLEFKLKELRGVVDHFVIVESKYTFVGNPKALHYEANKERFAEYADQIVHVIHDHNATDETGNAWSNEKEQRFFGLKGVETLGLASDDVVILSDLDEIADSTTLRGIKEHGLPHAIASLEQDMYYYNLTTKLREKWHRSKILQYRALKPYLQRAPDDLHTGIITATEPVPVVLRGGWHFSYFGDAAMVKNKIKNFSHTELAHFADATDEAIRDKIQSRQDLFDREIVFDKVAVADNDYLPANHVLLGI